MGALKSRTLELLAFGYYAAMVLLVIADYLEKGKLPGYDGWLYREASAAWAAGGDPWSVGAIHSHYSGAPTTVLAYLPTVLIPGDLWRSLSVLVSLAAAVYVLRAIRLPVYWLVYTPLTVAIILGQPGVLVLALLVSPLAAGAPLIKAFAGLPLLLRWREAVVAVGLGLATMVLASGLWLDWLRRLPEISTRLANELHGSQPPSLIALGGIALLVIIWRRPQHARWLAISALWPLPEYHYAIFALPTRLPWLLLAMAFQPGPWPVIAYAAFVLVADWLRDRDRDRLGRLRRPGPRWAAGGIIRP